MDRFSKSNLNANGWLKTACILSVLLVITLSLAGCDTTSAKEQAKSKTKKAKQVEAISTDSSESSDSSSATNSDINKEKDKKKGNDKNKSKEKSSSKKNDSSSSSTSSSSSRSPSSSSTTATKQKVWVPEQGHYEQVKVLKCRCGAEFNSAAEHATHRNNYIAEHRKTNPNFECKGEHLPKGWITKSVWKVDVPGHYEYR